MQSTDEQENRNNNDILETRKEGNAGLASLKCDDKGNEKETTDAEAEVTQPRNGLFGQIAKRLQNIIHTLTHDDSYDHHNYYNNNKNELILTKQSNNTPKKLLHGTYSEEEHYNKINEYVKKAKNGEGSSGLKELGFEYRVVCCEDHNHSNKDEEDVSLTTNEEEKKSEIDGMVSGSSSSETMIMKVDGDGDGDGDTTRTSEGKGGKLCHECCTRLFHIETDTAITEDNRLAFIADNEMYEEITKLCQEVAQEQMETEGYLEWITICDDMSKGQPIRALVTRKDAPYLEHNNNRSRSSVLIATGNGKVRAGIFSRQHLLITNIEHSTALPIVREATRRGMSIVLLDPNARGDRHAMHAFEQSLNILADKDMQTDDNPLYVLAHSAAGAQLVQCLNKKQNKPLLQRIKAIAFTDSTHNIQWTKNNQHLSSLLQSNNCLYFKSSNPHRDDDWDKTIAGGNVDTDQFWEHRFGKIRTLWAGTHEHSLTNYFARHHIWDHFDLATPFSHASADTTTTENASAEKHVIENNKDNSTTTTSHDELGCRLPSHRFNRFKKIFIV